MNWGNAMLTCKRMRNAVLLSAFLLVVGLVLQTLVETLPVAVPATYLALMLVLAAALVLALTLLASWTPGTSERLRECWH